MGVPIALHTGCGHCAARSCVRARSAYALQLVKCQDALRTTSGDAGAQQHVFIHRDRGPGQAWRAVAHVRVRAERTDGNMGGFHASVPFTDVTHWKSYMYREKPCDGRSLRPHVHSIFFRCQKGMHQRFVRLCNDCIRCASPAERARRCRKPGVMSHEQSGITLTTGRTCGNGSAPGG